MRSILRRMRQRSLVILDPYEIAAINQQPHLPH
jgi:hypothetical protein